MQDTELKFPNLAKELANLLKDDQAEWREYALYEHQSSDNSDLLTKKKTLREHVQKRAGRMLEILEEIGEPSLSNIGTDGALAISILATHNSIETTRRVLKSFNDLNTRDKTDARRASIPAMTDWLAVLEHKPQTFGTIWLMDEQGMPFLPSVKNFESVNERRTDYGIEPLRWPKSLAIPEDQQPWLNKPLYELTMRNPTAEEYAKFGQDYLI